MTERDRIKRPKVHQAYICNSEGHYELREFFWSEKSAMKRLKEELEEYGESKWEYEWGVGELHIER